MSNTRTDQHVWDELHAANKRAHSQGVDARAANAPITALPYKRSSDAAYWWMEGYYQRPFEILTSERDYARLRSDLAAGHRPERGAA